MMLLDGEKHVIEIFDSDEDDDDPRLQSHRPGTSAEPPDCIEIESSIDNGDSSRLEKPGYGMEPAQADFPAASFSIRCVQFGGVCQCDDILFRQVMRRLDLSKWERGESCTHAPNTGGAL